MSGARPPEAVLRAVLWKLSDFLPDLVILGGWVPYLHRTYGSRTGWRTEPVFTEELDLLLVPPIRPRAGRTIAEALREVGFRPVGGGVASAVWESETDPGERIEFFVDHGGPASTQASVHSVEHGGLGALSLHGLRLLRDHRVQLRVPVGRREGQAHAAAGDDVQDDVEREIREIAAAKGSSAQELNAGRHNLESVLREDGALRRLFEPTAEMVSGRYRTPMVAARPRLQGLLRDLVEILASAAAEG